MAYLQSLGYQPKLVKPILAPSNYGAKEVIETLFSCYAPDGFNGLVSIPPSEIDYLCAKFKIKDEACFDKVVTVIRERNNKVLERMSKAEETQEKKEPEQIN